MFEFLIMDYSNYDQPGDETPMRIVGLKGLIKEIAAAHEDNTICIAVYEIHECILDWSRGMTDKRGGDTDV